jgi:hypothetical protein
MMKRLLLGALSAGFAMFLACSGSDSPAGSSSSSSGGSSSGASSSGASSSGATSTSGGSSGGTSSTLSADEKAAFDDGTAALASVQQATMLADDFFDFDPTINPTQSAESNTQAIKSNMQSHGACGTIEETSPTGLLATLPNCTLNDGTKIDGSMNVGVSKLDPSTLIIFSFTPPGVVVNGKTLVGGPSFSTSDGTTFALGANLGPDTSTSYNLTGLTVAGILGSVEANGTMDIVKTGTQTNLTFTGVKWKRGECYPNAGTLQITRNGLTMTVTFSATSPTSGRAEVSVAAKSASEGLPQYGSCTAK